MRGIDALLPSDLRNEGGRARRRGRVTAGALLVTLLVDLILGGARFATGHSTPLVIPVALLLLGLLWSLRRTGRVDLVGHATSALLVIAVVALTILAGGVGTPPLNALAIVPLFAVFLVGARAGLAWALLCTALVVGFVLARAFHVPWPVEPDPERAFPGLGVVVLIFTTYGIGWLYDTSRERDEQAVAASAEEMRGVLLALPDVLVTMDARWLVRAVHAETGAGPFGSETIGRPFLEGFGGSVRERVAVALSEVGAHRREVELEVQSEGRTWNLRLVALEDGRILALARDVTHARALEAELMQARMRQTLERADRMSSVGLLAAGMAHEINNPLAYLSANLSVAEERLDHVDADTRSALADARDATDRIRRIVDDLRVYARDEDSGDEGPVQLAEVVETAVKLTRNELAHRAGIEVDAAEDVYVQGSASRLVQVVVNLLVNASHAMPTGHASAHWVRVRCRADGDRAILSVSDTGTGIPADVLPKITRPFFTTKPVGVGTGLGLSVCEGIVTQHDGELRIDSEVGVGTTVTLDLPRLARAGVSAPEAVRPVEARQGGRVLVVDDEALIRRAVKRVLRGHTVVEAESGAAALALLTEDPDFDVILCDLMMPELSGIDLHARLSSRDPALAHRMVFMTGGTFDGGVGDGFGKIAAEHTVLAKPFAAPELRAVVSASLAARATAE